MRRQSDQKGVTSFTTSFQSEGFPKVLTDCLSCALNTASRVVVFYDLYTAVRFVICKH